MSMDSAQLKKELAHSREALARAYGAQEIAETG